MSWLPIFAGIGAASGFFNYFQQKEASKASREFQYQQFLATKEAALASFMETGSQERSRTVQERTSLAEDIRDLALEKLAQTGAQSVSAAAGNVSGQTVQDIQSDTLLRASTAEARLRESQAFREAAAEFRLRSRAIQTVGRIKGALPGPSQEPSPFSLLFGGISGLGAGVALGQTFNEAFPPKSPGSGA